MASVYTTEITSDQLASDNPIHQRLLMPYVWVADVVAGHLLEVGCGEGRGIGWLMPRVTRYSAIDKIEGAIQRLRTNHPQGQFISGNIPPLMAYADQSFDCVVSFQVIEHIEDDGLFLKEIYRVLKPGGTAYLTTPNRPLSLSRNPWHIREYTALELTKLAQRYFDQVEMKGITGNEKVMQYHERNRQSVARLMRWDVLNLQYRLPAWMLRLPYEFMNRLNRNRLKNHADELVMSISHRDYYVTDQSERALDLFLIAKRAG
ncbi:MAG: class I SAM-dependent methyltransferase [Cyclobacteriaceae bacterium]|jgi:SAM-dependent methyltransferase|nr:class I SAM-dependent methyltransferase [Cyclobacteriaceae bacterium]